MLLYKIWLVTLLDPDAKNVSDPLAELPKKFTV
jgi:hypothetical protein